MRLLEGEQTRAWLSRFLTEFDETARVYESGADEISEESVEAELDEDSEEDDDGAGEEHFRSQLREARDALSSPTTSVTIALYSDGFEYALAAEGHGPGFVMYAAIEVEMTLFLKSAYVTARIDIAAEA